MYYGLALPNASRHYYYYLLPALWPLARRKLECGRKVPLNALRPASFKGGEELVTNKNLLGFYYLLFGTELLKYGVEVGSPAPSPTLSYYKLEAKGNNYRLK